METNILKDVPRPLLLVGIGNELKGDDAAGILLVRRIREPGPGMTLLDCGAVPENFLGAIARHPASSIVFADAAEMGEQPGAVRLFDEARVADAGVFTHGMSLQLLFEFLRNETAAGFYLLGIQPKSVQLGVAVSEEVSAAVETLAEQLSEKQPDKEN